MTSLPYNVLIVDDNPSEIILLKEALAEASAEIHLQAVINGFESLRVIQAASITRLPDILILDYHMPVMSGLDLLRKVALDSHWQEVPLIVWTSEPVARIGSACAMAGATEIRAKPHSFNDYVAFAHDLAAICKKPRTERIKKSSHTITQLPGR